MVIHSKSCYWLGVTMGMGLEPGNIRLCKIIMYSQRYYTLFFPGCQGPEENIYSSSGKFHTVSWREPSRPSTWATAWLPRGTRLGTPVMASARAFRSWMSTTGEACLAELTGAPAAGVHCDSPLGYQHINAGPGGGDAGDPVGDDGQPGPDQRRQDHGELGAGGSVGVPPGAAHETAVGVCVDIDVKVCVNFRGAQDDHVQTVPPRRPGRRDLHNGWRKFPGAGDRPGWRPRRPGQSIARP